MSSYMYEALREEVLEKLENEQRKLPNPMGEAVITYCVENALEADDLFILLELANPLSDICWRLVNEPGYQIGDCIIDICAEKRFDDFIRRS